MMPLVACPDWVADDVRTADHRDGIAAAYQSVAASATVRYVALEDPCEWHRLAFSAVVPIAYYAGHYRQDDPTRPCLGRNVGVDGIAGTDFRHVTVVTGSLIEAFRRELVSFDIHWDSLVPAQRALRLSQMLAVAIAEYVRIHPFLNGNGRTSRLLWTWGLLRYGLPPQCRVGHRPPPPYDTIMREAMRGNPAPLALEILMRMAAAAPTR